MEAFLDFERQAEVKDGGTSIVIFEQWMQTGEQALLDQIDEYNREDCIATRLLRDWLLELKPLAGPIAPAPPPPEPRPVPEAKEERAELRGELLEAGEELAAQLLDYHDRERKPVWWAYFDRMERTPEELLDDPEAISGLEQDGEPVRVDRSWAFTLVFPPQEHKLGVGQQTADRATGKSPGSITELDRESRRLVLKRGRSFEDVALPEAIVPKTAFNTPEQEAALMRFGRSLLAGDRHYPALESILRREPFDRPVQTSDLDEMKELVLGLDDRHLVIQGPPGSGKTWTSGRLIAHLLANGKTVGVASTSHKAIHNLLDAVVEAAGEIGISFDGRKKASAGNPESYYDAPGIEDVDHADEAVGADLAAGTAWLFARENQAVDYLFVDEAGQVSLADALAMGTAARNVVLVGDPQQLDQVIQGTHPFGSGASVLRHLLGDEATVPPDRGLFLERTYRLHPDVCGYISEEFYEGRLEPADVARERTTPLGTGLRYVAVEHDARRQESPEEVEAVRRVVAELRDAGVTDLVVVSPYNAQVNALAEALPGVRVGTVDKFQGQEADAVVYSMVSSSGEDVPRGLEFLLSRNRLNVAISRARCLAYLVASPRLLEVNARTIPQMRLANALCRFVELADGRATERALSRIRGASRGQRARKRLIRRHFALKSHSQDSDTWCMTELARDLTNQARVAAGAINGNGRSSGMSSRLLSAPRERGGAHREAGLWCTWLPLFGTTMNAATRSSSWTSSMRSALIPKSSALRSLARSRFIATTRRSNSRTRSAMSSGAGCRRTSDFCERRSARASVCSMRPGSKRCSKRSVERSQSCGFLRRLLAATRRCIS